MLTSDRVAISVVNFFDSSISERQFPHPVDAAAHAGGQAQAGVGRRRVEAVRPKIVITAQQTKQQQNKTKQQR